MNNCGKCVTDCQFAGRNDLNHAIKCEERTTKQPFTSPMDEYSPSIPGKYEV